MQTMATCKSEQQGGYNCEFVEQPPKYLQVECPVCLQILRDPFLISCCGYYFCKVCIERVQDDNKPCPTCNEQNFTVLANKGHQRMLNGFFVRCSNEKDGCKWTGELGSLDVHINATPKDTNQLDGCDYTQINCAFCDDSFKRIEIENHQKNDCPKRPFTCEYCHTYETNYDDVVNSHWSVCGSKPVECPNKCGENPLREDLDDHEAEACPLTLVECEFPGCKDEVPRKGMPEHLQNEQLKHMSLLANRVVSLTKCNAELESETRTLRKQLASFKEEARKRLCLLEGSHFFTMVNVSQFQKKCESQCFEPIYTHYHGYKIKIEAGFEDLEAQYNKSKFSRGSDYDLFVIRAYLVKGKFDDDLEWPIKGRVKICAKDYETQNFDRTLMSTDFVENRPWMGIPVLLKLVMFKFGNIKSQYIANDSLYLRIKFVVYKY